ncbi:FAD-dependent oxidoreductase [Micromonospora sp. WMMD956]|nr:FAD-dependent oxidoreductase [Micromonospora sp. WMMD956]MDG4815993.1 FAD-dependent oxidoreductase [Micromonospora sp. WMMD956]
MTTGLEHVLRPGRIGRLALPHRVVTGAMHLGWEARDDGGAALAAFYVERARGGAGLMVTGGAAVSPEGAGGPGYGVLDDARFRARLRRVAAEVRAAGGLLALQLFHAGRYARPPAGGPHPVAPSAVYSAFSRHTPTALDAAGIARTVADFARGAAHARDLGFAAVEIMGSEGYLLDQFLSPLTNLRDDEWGGDPQRRSRFPVAVVRAVRAAVGPDFPVIVRMTGDDLLAGGTTRDDVLAYARALAAAGADALNVGVGWHESPVPTVQAVVPPGHWVPVAAAVKAAVGALPVLASNRINRLSQAEAVLAGTPLDLVSMARPFLADPALVANARAGRPVNVCVACNQACIDRSLADEPVSCMVNPRVGREHEPAARPAASPRRVAVVGAGPAGLRAAHGLALAGHRVTVYEADDEPGGQFRLAGRVPGKSDYLAAVGFLVTELARLGVALRTGRRITAADRDLLGGYAGVVVATGVLPRPASIPGVDLPHVLGYPAAFADGALGERVVVIGGGGVAVDVAHLASHPAGPARRVTVLHRGRRLGPRLGRSTRWAVLAELRRQRVDVVPGVRDLRISPAGVHFADAEGQPRVVPADTVVIAAGQVPDDGLVATVRAAGVWHHVVGGARDTAGLDAVRAFAEGAAAAEAFRRAQDRAGQLLGIEERV